MSQRKNVYTTRRIVVLLCLYMLFPDVEVLGALRSLVTDAKTITHTIEMWYDGDSGSLEPRRKNNGKPLSKDPLHIMPGDRVKVSIGDPKSTHSLGEWRSRFRWEEGGKVKVVKNQWVRKPRKARLGDGADVTLVLRADSEVPEGEVTHYEHNFKQNRSEEDFGVVNVAHEVRVMGKIDISKPAASEFRKPHGDATMIEGPKRTADSVGKPKFGLWYTITINIDRRN